MSRARPVADGGARSRRVGGVLLAAYVAVMIAGNFPSRFVRGILHGLTLDQAWDVFAPDPMRTDVELRATVELRDGGIETWTPPRARPALALLTYHWDLWATAAALGDPMVGERTAQWIAEQHGGGERVAKVTLTRRWAELPPPGSTIAPQWHETDFRIVEPPRAALAR